jgi:hypothetical protein
LIESGDVRGNRDSAERLTVQALREITVGLDAIPALEAAVALLRAEAGELPAGEKADLRDLADEADTGEPAEPAEPAEGWSRIIPPSRKSHYFVRGRSLCGRFGFPPLPLQADDHASSDDCAACRKKLALRKRKA